jgi:hypothetical protein
MKAVLSKRGASSGLQMALRVDLALPAGSM